MTSVRMLRGGAVACASALALAASCFRPAEDHVELDRDVGEVRDEGTTWAEADGLAAVRSFAPGEISLWGASPVLHLTASLAPDAPSEWLLEVRNAMPDAEIALVCDDGQDCGAVALDAERSTIKRWRLRLVPGADAQIVVAPPDADEPTPFRFAVMSDVQRNGIDDVEDLFLRMNEDPSIRFVVSTGDLTDRGELDELLLFQQKLTVLDVPFYTTLGNHEIAGDVVDWHEIYGPFNVFFVFKDVFFTLVDSSAATIDPQVYDILEPWLGVGEEEVNVFATHVPPLDPVGPRNFAFRSRSEAAKLLNMLAEHDVDVAFYGHLHTFESYATGGIPAYISGGGGALEEHLDGVGRHYLTVDVTPAAQVDQVALVRIEAH